MKLIRILPPIVALIVMGTWIGVQRLAISAMEKENGLMQKNIAAARYASAGSAIAQTKVAATEKLMKDDGAIDWRKIAGQLVEVQRSGGIGDTRVITRFQQRLQEMTAEEIVAAVAEVSGLELSPASQLLLDRVLMQVLTQKSPEQALKCFASRLQSDDGSAGLQLVGAMRELAKSDVGKAVAWLDEQIAAGRFESKSLDGRSQTRILFEGAMLGVLLAVDPATAGRRLVGLPADQRGDVVGNVPLDENNVGAFAKMIRSKMAEGDQVKAFARQTAQCVAAGGYARAGDFLNRIKATPVERVACVEQAVATVFLTNERKIVQDDIDAMRAWVATQEVVSVDVITGKLLSAAALGNRKLTYEEAAELAVRYNQVGGKDEVLIAFVENWAAGGNKEQARTLARKITDEQRRTEMLKRLE